MQRERESSAGISSFKPRVRVGGWLMWMKCAVMLSSVTELLFKFCPVSNQRSRTYINDRKQACTSASSQTKTFKFSAVGRRCEYDAH